MNSKVWLTVFGLVAVLLLGGAGYYAFSSFGKYSEAMETWNSQVGTIESLEGRSLYPNQENEDALRESVVSYDGAVKELFTSLNTFQKELDKELANTEFQQRVKTRVEDFRGFAQSGGLEIVTDEEFELGFNVYSANLPQPDLVAVLDYELDAIDNLLRELVVSGADRLTSFTRDPIPGEAGGADEQESGVVHKYPVRLRTVTSHEALQTFLNKLANDKDYFYIVRVLKVKNQVTEGATKGTSLEEQASLPSFQDPNTKQFATYDMLQEWGYPTEPEDVVEQNASAAGFVSSSTDARVLMGQENLEVFMVVDITRFIDPEEQAAAEAAKKETDSKSSRRK